MTRTTYSIRPAASTPTTTRDKYGVRVRAATSAAERWVPVPRTDFPPARPLEVYVIAVVVSVLAILSPYYLRLIDPAVTAWISPLWVSVLIVYGIPILTLALLLGRGPLKGATGHMDVAAVRGLAWFGSLSVLALVVGFAIILLYSAIDPSLLAPLSNPNPALAQAADDPWFWVAFSFAVGVFEELIFRGWIFGYWLQRGSPRWIIPALWTSALFAGVHLYYGFTYLAASPIAFVTLFLTGFGFAATRRDSGGNLVVIILLHGAFDATAFLVLVSEPLGLALRYGLILLGAVIAFALYLSRGTVPPGVPLGRALPPRPSELGTALPVHSGAPEPAPPPPAPP